MLQAKQWAVDIETIPDMDVVSLLPEVEASKTLKDPEKIALDIERKKQEQIEKMALNPLFGKIACICLVNKEEKIFLAGEEKNILERFFNITFGCQLITYNGINFDIPFIYKRAIKLGVENINLNQMKLYTNKYSNFNHIDIMNEFCNYGQYEKLDTVAKIYLGKGKVDCDVKEIPEMIKTEEGLKQLKEYCMADTELTWELAEKFGFIDNNIEGATYEHKL